MVGDLERQIKGDTTTGANREEDMRSWESQVGTHLIVSFSILSTILIRNTLALFCKTIHTNATPMTIISKINISKSFMIFVSMSSGSISKHIKTTTTTTTSKQITTTTTPPKPITTITTITTTTTTK